MAAAIIAFLTAFLGSAVESVEALTVVLAVGVARGWRSALEGTAAGVVILVVLVATVGGVLLTRVPEGALKLVIGTLILLFGARWLRKSLLRAVGVVSRHDEAHAYAAAQRRLQGGERRDGLGFALALQAVLLEGTEVAFIVFAAGSGGRVLGAASIGGAAGIALVAGLGIAVRKPLTRVPENTLKYVTGVALATLGTFWAAEGMGFSWPLDVASLVPIAAVYLAASALAVTLGRRSQRTVAAAS